MLPLAFIVATKCGLMELSEPANDCDPLESGYSPPSSSGGPAARIDFGLTLSATRGALWVVGGVDVQTGLPLDDAWSFDLTTGQWERLPTAVGLERVRAATYVAAEDRLYVLDENSNGYFRLVRIDPVFGVADTVLTRPRATQNTQFALAAGMYGDLVLACSTPAGAQHVVHRLATNPNMGWRTTHYRIGTGPLASEAARTDARGVVVFAGDEDKAGVTGHLFRDFAVAGQQVPACL